MYEYSASKDTAGNQLCTGIECRIYKHVRIWMKKCDKKDHCMYCVMAIDDVSIFLLESRPTKRACVHANFS